MSPEQLVFRARSLPAFDPSFPMRLEIEDDDNEHNPDSTLLYKLLKQLGDHDSLSVCLDFLPDGMLRQAVVARSRSSSNTNKMNGKTIDWGVLGRELRESAKDAHGSEDLPSVPLAYQFLLENPECSAWRNGQMTFLLNQTMN